MKIAETSIFANDFFVMISVFWGFLSIRSLSYGSTLSASAGSPSVMRFIQRIWSARSGRGNFIIAPIIMPPNIVRTSPRLLERR
jgi:hypothetical protein